MLKLLLNIVMLLAVLITVIYVIFRITKSNTTKFKKSILIILLIIIVWTILFSLDYILAQNQKTPIFSIQSIFHTYQDGGTIEYFGIGYKVIDFHKLVYGYPGWEDELKFEKVYICPWHVSYDEAFKKLEREHIEEGR